MIPGIVMLLKPGALMERPVCTLNINYCYQQNESWEKVLGGAAGGRAHNMMLLFPY
jgi:hypothetical protein